jgi:hypothetical protein
MFYAGNAFGSTGIIRDAEEIRIEIIEIPSQILNENARVSLSG